MKLSGLWIITIAASIIISSSAQAGRHEQLTDRFSKGNKMTPVAATYFGGPSNEEFVGVGQLPDGTIVAFGNAAGPQFPSTPSPVVLGKGQHRGLKSGTMAPENPDMAGMIVYFNENLSQVSRVVRFDWGVASLSFGVVSGDGKSLLLAGRCTEAFRDLAKSARSSKVEPLETPPETADKKARRPSVGPYTYEGVTHPGDVFLARVSLSGDKIEWVWIFEGMRQPPEKLWTDKAGALYCDIRGMRKISADGQNAEMIHPKASSGQAGWRAVDPIDGGLYFGGDRNTHTGRQPYRQPYLYKFDQKQQRLWTIWEPVPKECACGGDGNGLCSDSSVRGMSFLPNGDFLVLGWSDGGNSVFTRQPKDWRLQAGTSALGMDSWGMKNANSLSYLMVIDRKTMEQKAYTLWLAYIPETFADPKFRGAPNGTSISTACGLADGSIAIIGGSATGLVQTPNAFVKPPSDGRKFGGSFVAVLSKELNDLLFSSYMPSCQLMMIAPTKRGMAVVGRALPNKDEAANGKTPLIKPIQGKLQGEMDAHILLLDLPNK